MSDENIRQIAFYGKGGIVNEYAPDSNQSHEYRALAQKIIN